MKKLMLSASSPIFDSQSSFSFFFSTSYSLFPTLRFFLSCCSISENKFTCPLDEAILKLAELAPRNSVKMSTAPSVSVVGFVFSLHLFSLTHAIGNYIYLPAQPILVFGNGDTKKMHGRRTLMTARSYRSVLAFSSAAALASS